MPCQQLPPCLADFAALGLSVLALGIGAYLLRLAVKR